MSLLQVITKAAEDHPKILNTSSEYPITLNSSEIFQNLKPENPDSDDEPMVRKVTGWSINDHNSEIMSAEKKFTKQQKRNLKSLLFDIKMFTKSLDRFLTKITKICCKVSDIQPGDEKTLIMLRNACPFLSSQVKALISECCVRLEHWELMEAIIFLGFIRGISHYNLVRKLVDAERGDLLCQIIRHTPDLGHSEIAMILNYFLSPKNDHDLSINSVRKNWENQALWAIDKAAQSLPHKTSDFYLKIHNANSVQDHKTSDSFLKTHNTNSVQDDAALLLAMAYDGFSAFETCLHFLFSPSLEGLVLSYAISKLQSVQLYRLIRYTRKWVKKYSRFPGLVPWSPESGSEFEACKWVPSLESIIKVLGVVLDEHYSYLVLDTVFHEELRSIQETVMPLVSEGNVSCSVSNLLKSLRCES
ncbi:hypothetical protein AMTRI_Chr05g73920 [Amborella trichopoda]